MSHGAPVERISRAENGALSSSRSAIKLSNIAPIRCSTFLLTSRHCPLQSSSRLRPIQHRRIPQVEGTGPTALASFASDWPFHASTNRQRTSRSPHPFPLNRFARHLCRSGRRAFADFFSTEVPPKEIQKLIPRDIESLVLNAACVHSSRQPHGTRHGHKAAKIWKSNPTKDGAEISLTDSPSLSVQWRREEK